MQGEAEIMRYSIKGVYKLNDKFFEKPMLERIGG